MVRLKSGPEDLPASHSLLVVIIVLATIPDLLTLALIPLPGDVSPALLLAVGIGTTLLWYGAILRLAGVQERFLQTLTAVFGIQIILAPALVWITQSLGSVSYSTTVYTVCRHIYTIKRVNNHPVTELLIKELITFVMPVSNAQGIN
jgi:hypothetical protein